MGADGSKSHVRAFAGIKTTGWKYPQNAIICTVEHPVENSCAWQRFLRSGPIALLPMGDNFSNIVWTMDPTEAADRRSMDEADFLKAVNEALDNGHGPHPQSKTRGGEGLFSWLKLDITSSANELFEVPPRITKLASQRMMFPLSLMHANSYVSKRIVLVGDAAHTVHPLAGQGVNMGFGDASSLSRVIAEGVAVGSDIGEVCSYPLDMLSHEYAFPHMVEFIKRSIEFLFILIELKLEFKMLLFYPITTNIIFSVRNVWLKLHFLCLAPWAYQYLLMIF